MQNLANIVYFVPGIENVNKRKHLLFLQKNGFSLSKVTTKANLKEKVSSLKPISVIVNDEESLLESVDAIGETPVIVIAKNHKNVNDIMASLPEDMPNVIFFRSETDPLDTITETIRLILSMSNEERAVQ